MVFIKSLIINTADNVGGAARAAYRLHKGLQDKGIKSQMLVQNKYSDDYSIISPQTKILKILNKKRSFIDGLPLKLYKERQITPWGIGWLPNNITQYIKQIDPNIIHLHWICGGFIPISLLKNIKYPLVWTLHDSWAFTGGCHIPYECTRYRSSCGKCPQLNTQQNFDLSRWNWERKNKFWKDINLTIVSPSHWLADCARSSSLLRKFPIKVIPNGINLSIFKPIDKKVARSILNLPFDKKLILFGAMSSTSDPNKGFRYLNTALNILKTDRSWNMELLVFGASGSNESQDLGFKANYFGVINDNPTLSLLYSAADIFIAPSKQENLPNTVMEALACGTPCVAFDIGGMPDMIEHQANGYLVKPFEEKGIAEGIAWVLSDETRWAFLSRRAREKIEQKFNIEKVAEQYILLYKEILEKSIIG